MKTTITAMLMLLLVACGGGGSDPITVTELPPQPDEQTPTDAARIVFVYNPATPELGTSDGQYFYHLAADHAANAHNGFVAIGDILSGIDNTGSVIIQERLPIVPDAVAIAGGDIWCFKNIDPETAQSSGAAYDWYTKIYRNNSEYGLWWNNRYKTVVAVATESGDAVVIDQYGRLHVTDEPNLQLWYAWQDNLIIHSLDIDTMQANIRGANYDIRVSFATNYFIAADQWLKADNVYYSWNGYIWSDGKLQELATDMKQFISAQPEAPVVIAAGTHIEYNETVLYWIECNYGNLFRYTPSLDRVEFVMQLYQGSGLREDGQAAAVAMRPVVAADYLFFNYNNTVWRYDFASQTMQSFAAGVEVWGM